MPEPHLPDLLIEGYRGLRRLELKKLGNVNLIVGRNGVGKTSVLEAVRLYSTQADIETLAALLHLREELYDPSDPHSFEAFFFARDSRSPIRIGNLEISLTEVSQTLDPFGNPFFQFPETGVSPANSPRLPALRVDQSGILQRYTVITRHGPSIGTRNVPGRLSNPDSLYVDSTGLNYQEFGRLWDRIVLTDFEEVLNSTLTLVDQRIQRVSLVQKDGGTRRAMVKLRGNHLPAPLRTLGDGVYRFIGIALALANARNGFLLIDEFENGLHYTTQESLWRFLIQTARELNVQVFATTHSRDCISAFGRATAADRNSTGILFRLEEFNGDIVETHFDENSIATITENLIEVR